MFRKKREAEVQQIRLPQLKVFEGDKLIQIASEPRVSLGEDFSRVELTRDHKDNMLLTTMDVTRLQHGARVRGRLRGKTVELQTLRQ